MIGMMREFHCVLMCNEEKIAKLSGLKGNNLIIAENLDLW